MKMSLVDGIDKTISVRMSWKVSLDNGKIFSIYRYKNGNANASSFVRKQIQWQVKDAESKLITIPPEVRRNEFSIAKWLNATFK